MTEAQKAIMQVVHENPHKTAEYIFMEMKKTNPSTALGTVYRNLGRFSDSGVIRRIPLGDYPDIYDPNVTPHYHTICTKCACAEDIELPGLGVFIEKHTEKKIESFELLLYYICDECH